MEWGLAGKTLPNKSRTSQEIVSIGNPCRPVEFVSRGARVASCFSELTRRSLARFYISSAGICKESRQ
jgi:hypothetical protein